MESEGKTLISEQYREFLFMFLRKIQKELQKDAIGTVRVTIVEPSEAGLLLAGGRILSGYGRIYEFVEYRGWLGRYWRRFRTPLLTIQSWESGDLRCLGVVQSSGHRHHLLAVLEMEELLACSPFLAVISGGKIFA